MVGGMNKKPESESDSLYDEHRRQAWADIQSSTDSFDQSLLTLSSAALGISLVFIKEIVPFENAVWLWLLYTSWSCFSACIIVTIMSFQVSITAQNAYLKSLFHYYKEHDSTHFNKRTRSGKTLRVMTWCAAALFFAGLVTTLVFCIYNVTEVRESNMSKSKLKSSYTTDGRAPLQMTPPSVGQAVHLETATERPGDSQRGREPVTMTPVPATPQPATTTPSKEKK